MRIRRTRCPHLKACKAQPRIETGKTPSFVHAAIPTASLGASVIDGVVLSVDEPGAPIGKDRLLVIDEIPDLFNETECPASRIREAIRMTNFSHSPSLVRGSGFTEADDAQDRLLVLDMLCNRLQETMQADAAKRGVTYATTLPGEEVSAVVLKLAESLVDDPRLVGLYDLFQVGMVYDPYSLSGERPCIPLQRQWTVRERGEDRRTVEHVEAMIHFSVVKVCRAVAAIFSGEVRAGAKLVATLRDDLSLRVLEPREMHLPKSVGTAVLSAGIPLFSRLYRALHPKAEIRVVDVRLEQQSPTFRVQLLTQAFTAKSVNRAFEGGASEHDAGKKHGEAPGHRNEKAKASFLGSLRRALAEAATVVRREQCSGAMPGGPHRTLLVSHSAAVHWLVSDDGKEWLLRNVPPELSIDPGDPFSLESDEWGAVVYWGGRGRGENLWLDYRVCITLGDPLPNIGDMEARWGDVVDPDTGECFDPSQVAIWYAQESVMQALGRTRPGRAGKPTVLLHAGQYFPVGFELEGPWAAEVILAEGTRGDARRARTGMKIASALAAEKEAHGGVLSRGSATRIARVAGVDPTTARKYMGDGGLGGLEALLGERADTGISHTSILKGEIPVSARLFELVGDLLTGAIAKGASLPSPSTVAGILEDIKYPHVPAKRTVQTYLKKLRGRLASDSSLIWEGRQNARESWAAVVVASIEFMGLRQRFQVGAERLLLEVGGGDQEEDA